MAGQVQPLDAALGHQALGAMAPAVLENWRIFIVMPPPPSLPDSMVIDDRPVDPRPETCTLSLRIQFCDRVRTARVRTHLARTHPSMSFQLTIFEDLQNPKGNENVARVFWAATAKNHANIGVSDARATNSVAR
jgi:hypothetical protein